jgi:hypothetical protein
MVQENSMADATAPDEGNPACIQRELRELIAALDRRVPHVERLGELGIARAATALKRAAELRLAALEADTAPLTNAPVHFAGVDPIAKSTR